MFLPRVSEPGPHELRSRRAQYHLAVFAEVVAVRMADDTRSDPACGSCGSSLNAAPQVNPP